MEDLHGKRAYIIGGSSGIGLAIAEHLARHRGTDIVLFGRSLSKLKKAQQQLAPGVASPRQVNCLSVDVDNEEAVNVCMTEAMRTFGRPDILVLSAGTTATKRFVELSAEDFNGVLQTNVQGTVNCLRALMPEMVKTGGKIMLVSSLAGFMGIFGYSAYCASKFALVGLAESLRWELEETPVDLCVLCPPEVATPLIELEKETIPKETRAAKDLLGTLEAEYVAAKAVSGMLKGKFVIIPGFKARLMYLVSRVLPKNLIYRLTLKMVALTMPKN
ncbi:SDR family NAD(P)-dependent oxidoreductase [Desulforhopalus singaporensis]|uniref:Short-chain dehydrogenase n=1 Tax=Desulforhopalus singaporensis TaxID=91360 RepID=A0A1H0V849_9BACT|nr:SDR family NAD(P)-dependent oxidoreductase [Desulforhopalus singaporensis]SDP74378.1 Short-chain dehydrogenase [Desulforhopalus singaporensis]